MSFDFAALQTNTYNVLASDGYFKSGGTGLIVTLADGFRSEVAEKLEIYEGYDPGSELPAVVTSCGAFHDEEIRVEIVGYGEHDLFIPMLLVGVIADSNGAVAKTKGLEILDNMVRVVEKQVTSGQDWDTAEGVTIVDSIRPRCPHWTVSKNVVLVKPEVRFVIQVVTAIEGV